MNDSQNGIGIEAWIDKSLYKGEYIKGKKHGIGNNTLLYNFKKVHIFGMMDLGMKENGMKIISMVLYYYNNIKGNLLLCR